MIFPRGYEMSFVSYSHLILLINDQTFEITVAREKIWQLKGPEVARHNYPIVPRRAVLNHVVPSCAAHLDIYKHISPKVARA